MNIQNIYLEILALDSLYGVLSWYERCWLHLESIGKAQGEASHRIKALYTTIDETGWEAPHRRAGQDRCGQYQENGEWKEIEKYPKDHPELTQQLKTNLQ